MSRRSLQYKARHAGKTGSTLGQAISEQHSRSVKSTGRTQIKRDPSKPQRGTAIGSKYQIVKTQLGNDSWQLVPQILVCSEPIKTEKVARLMRSIK